MSKAMPPIAPITETNTYNTAARSCLLCSNAMVSKVNVEKVVKPPSTPVATNNCECRGRQAWWDTHTSKAPTSKPPKSLMNRVRTENNTQERRVGKGMERITKTRIY